MLDFAIRRSGDAAGRVVFLLILAVVVMLGLVWVSIAVAGLLALNFRRRWLPRLQVEQ